MSLNDIIERFTLVSGLEMNEVSRFLPLLIDCKEYFEERMADGLSDSHRRRLAHACAVYAYYRVCLTRTEGACSSIKAGDLQLTGPSRGELRDAARDLWREEREAVAGMVDLEDGFAFRSVTV